MKVTGTPSPETVMSWQRRINDIELELARIGERIARARKMRQEAEETLREFGVSIEEAESYYESFDRELQETERQLQAIKRELEKWGVH